MLRAIGNSEADQRMELNIPENVDNRANELLGIAAVTRILAAQTEQQLVVVGTSIEE